jgi:murein DD-endopeptidase MepM/ murein hydrolase activator NlpD
LNADVQRVGVGGPGDEGESRVTNEISELLRRARLLSFSWREARDTLESKHDRLEATPSIVPTHGFLSSAYQRSRMHPIYNRARPHTGVDITANTGTPIVAAAKGRVISAGWEGNYGNMVEIDHGYGVVTRYAHASKILVRRGQTVERGDKVALVGKTGLAVGPHLHYEVLVNGKATNPAKYFLDMDVIAD